MNELDEPFKKNFMGSNGRQVPFLGHSIGLQVDEQPVISKGFNQPIEENMVFAIEPKKAISGVGTVGVEDTYIVTKNGAKCITGESKGLIQL
jgi:Xaa-Pro aminopeptidase